jgi:hypothetical protein
MTHDISTARHAPGASPSTVLSAGRSWYASRMRATAVSFATLVTLVLGSRAAAAEGAAPSVAVVESRGGGVHPASLSAVTRQLYATTARLGYRSIPEGATAGAVGPSAGPVALSPADLLRTAEATHADHALAATVFARDAQYVVTITLANADRTGPFTASATTDAASLEPEVDRMTRSLLPAVPTSTEATDVSRAGPADAHAPSRLAIQTEAAFGIASHPFYNHLLGARYDYAFTQDFALGGYLGYANLKGKDGRTSNVLPYLQLEYRMHWSRTSEVRVPLRFGTGYLPKNGPVLRAAAGLSFPVGETTHLGFDLITPTLWIIDNRAAFSLDLAAELSFDL